MKNELKSQKKRLKGKCYNVQYAWLPQEKLNDGIGTVEEHLHLIIPLMEQVIFHKP